MVESGKEKALRTKVHFNSITLFDRFLLQMDVTHQLTGTIGRLLAMSWALFGSGQ